MRLTFKAKVLIMIIVTVAMVAVYLHLISWRASMVSHYNGMPGGEMLIPLAVLGLLKSK